jgi:hypothetical protein
MFTGKKLTYAFVIPLLSDKQRKFFDERHWGIDCGHM